MVLLKGVSIAIEARGVPLKEYHNQERSDTDTSAFRYVEAIENARFGVRYEMASELKSQVLPIAGFKILFYANGENIVNRVWHIGDEQKRSISARRYYREGKRSEEDLMFSEILIGKMTRCINSAL